MPDGSKIEIGSAYHRAPEVLFRPEVTGEEYDGIPQCVATSILVCFSTQMANESDFYLIFLKKCDLDLRKVLYQNILLSGGSTLFPGFGDRLISEV